MQRVVLSRPDGLEVAILTYGAALQAIVPPGRDGAERSLILGFAEHRRLHPHGEPLTSERPSAGMPTASRAARLVIDGTTHRLSRNEGEHHLHGGHVGFDRKVWEIRRCGRDGEPSLALGYHSADGEEGYPGAVDVEVEYTLVRCEHAADAIPSNARTGGRSSI